jgi:short-subunit dehydrogenase
MISIDCYTIERTFGVNSLAHFWTTKSILPLFEQRRYGHVVTVASTMGLVAVAHMSKDPSSLSEYDVDYDHTMI